MSADIYRCQTLNATNVTDGTGNGMNLKKSGTEVEVEIDSNKDDNSEVALIPFY